MKPKQSYFDLLPQSWKRAVPNKSPRMRSDKERLQKWRANNEKLSLTISRIESNNKELSLAISRMQSAVSRLKSDPSAKDLQSTNHQTSTMTNQDNSPCWETLQNLRNLGVGAPFVDCLFNLHYKMIEQQINNDEKFQRYENVLLDLREQSVKKDNDIEQTESDDLQSENHNFVNDQLAKMIKVPEHTIIIDNVIYYSAKHYKPTPGSVVVGFVKYLPCLVHYSKDKSRWYMLDRWKTTNSALTLDIIAWTYIPHPRSYKKFRDFCDSL